jgi:hypothetical protein
MDSALDLLQRATTTLAQGGSVKERLADSYARYLIQIDVDELPESVSDDFIALCAAMRREQPQPNESAIRASVRKMSNEEAARFAAKVVSMFAIAARNAGVMPVRRLARGTSSAPIVKLFSTDSAAVSQV